MSRLAELEVSSLPERAAARVSDSILAGRWKPGEQIFELRVAKELGVGQSVVREALRILEFRGLVMKIPNKGTFVTRVTRKQVEQIFALRVELEARVLSWARELNRPRPEDTEKLNEILARMEQAAGRGDLVAFCNADFDFHHALWELCENPYIVRALEAFVAPQFAFMLLLAYPSMDLVAIVPEHVKWLQMFQSASPAQIEAYTRQAIQRFREEVFDSLDLELKRPE